MRASACVLPRACFRVRASPTNDRQPGSDKFDKFSLRDLHRLTVGPLHTGAGGHRARRRRPFLLFLDYGCLGGAEASAHRESTKRRDRTLRRHLTKLVLLHKDHSAAERPTRRRKAYTVLRRTQSEDATRQRRREGEEEEEERGRENCVLVCQQN